jgi:hypothetical protein
MSAATECPDCGFTLNLQADRPAECLICGYVDDVVIDERQVPVPCKARRRRSVRRRPPPVPWRYPRNNRP